MEIKHPVKETNLKGLNLLKQGKVRDIYDFGNTLLIVATDRISAFDVVMDDPIPEKGRILTQISAFWFNAAESIILNHMISIDPDDFPAACQAHREILEGRSMLVHRAEPLPVECIVRGYLAGSGFKDYQRTGSICGHGLPPGLRESDRLPEPIFTPSTKAESGHDENISFDRMVDLIGEDLSYRLRNVSLALYQKGVVIAEHRGIIIADTKFEFGLIDNEPVLIDELLTPDSSRFWPKDKYRPGVSQPSFDKQFLRDYLESLNWDKTPPPPELPEEIVSKTSEKYKEAWKRLTSGDDIMEVE
ncbi:MAG TPA: phosphoribosylaminoimidazolesuccinocarboxamide synthase [Deltaproteobacteria bacterium]|nr:phosphoribosylaminoimidazolesuccinocarboxamide synthase [Deltaproteobacteria bacterium]